MPFRGGLEATTRSSLRVAPDLDEATRLAVTSQLLVPNPARQTLLISAVAQDDSHAEPPPPARCEYGSIGEALINYLGFQRPRSPCSASDTQ
jgi:hypothetical protein